VSSAKTAPKAYTNAKGDTDMFTQIVENASLYPNHASRSSRILLMKPPFFTPWTPPLGISIIKSYLEQQGHSVRCYDYNTDSFLWSTHHKYFTALQSLDEVSINDGYSKLWWVLNAHMLAYVNGGDSSACSSVIEGVTPCYGIRYDRSIIKTLLEIVRKYFHRLEELTDQIDLSEFDVAGVSTYTTSLASSLFILRKIKRKYPQIMTVMGGGIFADDLALGSDNLNTLIEEYDYIDHVILGEGEKLFLKLLGGELANKRVISIGDIEGKTLEMKDVPSPDFSDLKAENYYHLTIEGARSCPFQCSFCSETIQWGNYRKKPVDLFAEQVVELARRYNNNAFFLGDSLMNPYIVQFANALLKTGANILYDGYLRADKPVTNREWVKTWAKSGLYRTRMGIESASARVLKEMDKMTTPATISKVLKTLSGAGIRTTTYWIVGFPGETEEDFQETLDFIGEHHRFIYELEAHPYNYTPYGQVGSRLYQSYSVYPDSVTDIIRFKVWDIVGVGPSREERYDRLVRISKFVSELGVPNIYSMADRYQAEERWFRLHPLTKEIYQGTMKRREENVLDTNVVNPVEWSASSFKPSPQEPSQVLIHRIDITGKLEINHLREAIPCLVRYNNTIQMCMVDTVFHEDGHDRLTKNGLATVDLSDKPTELVDQQMTAILDDVVGQINNSATPLLRIMLIRKSIDVSELIILAHRSVVDAKSLVILSEELYRIYKQLANQVEISLPEIPKTYLDYLKGMNAGRVTLTDWRNRPASNSSSGRIRAVSPAWIGQALYVLDDVSPGEMFSNSIQESGVKPAEILLAAILRTVTYTESERLLLINVDYRIIDPALSNTVGPLTGVYLLPRSLAEEKNLFSFVRSIRGAIGSHALNDSDNKVNGNVTNGLPVLIDLEYVVEPPWLEGDEWSTSGFIVDNKYLSSDYSCVITPLVTRRGVEIWVGCRDHVDNIGVDDAISGYLASNLKACMDECREYVMGQRFWLREFREPPQAVLEASIDQAENGLPERKIAQYQIDHNLLRSLEEEYTVSRSILVLSAFTVMLSRLNGCENITILIALYEHDELSLLPLKLHPSWNLTFQQYAQEVDRKVSEANRYGAFAVDILEKGIPSLENDRSPLTLDVACILSYGQMLNDRSVEGLLKKYPALCHDISIALLVDSCSNRIGVSYDYQPSKLAKKKLDKLSGFLLSILAAVRGEADIQIGDIPLEPKAKPVFPSETYINDTFKF
jgi:radical SAM superfamily enzyme YgiQ (UPF0313 family)